jgi:hypothetical protein
LNALISNHHAISVDCLNRLPKTDIDTQRHHVLPRGFRQLLRKGAKRALIPTVSGRVFFLDNGAGRVLSANPDGSDLKTLISEGRKFPDRLAVDVAAGHSETLKRPGKLSSETTHLLSRIVADSNSKRVGRYRSATAVIVVSS